MGLSRRSTRGPGRAFRLPLVVTIAAIAVLAAFGSAFASDVPEPAPRNSVATGAPPESFAERAGFSSSVASEVGEATPAGGDVEVVLTFEPSTPAFFAGVAAGTPPMTVGQIAQEYGLSSGAYAEAEQYFESQGLRVLHAWPDRLSLSLTGPASSVGTAFGTELESGQLDGRAVTFAARAPSLPSALESEVASVAGLSAGFDQFTLPSLATATGVKAASTLQPSDNLVYPSIGRDIYDVSGLYNLTASPTYATGEGIVLLLWGWGYAPSDLATFFSQFYPASLPQPTIVPYPVDGAPYPSANAPHDPSNGSRELTLDLEWSGSMAAGATLDAVYAPDGPAQDGYSPSDASMIDALNTAVDPSDVPNVATISMSFGSADGGDPTLTTGFETDFATAAHEGISAFAATGDTGGDVNSDCTGGPQPEYPSTSPQVVAVGGTSVTLDRDALGTVTGFSESAWSMGGGGFSTQFSAPTWQDVGSAAAPIEANGHRGTPDVAATAGYNFLYFDGTDEAGGGTSFATPLWAGTVTEMDALQAGGHHGPFGFFTPALYALASAPSKSHGALNDITSGGNCLGLARAGWDTATGWGSPNAVLLYEDLVATFVTVSMGVSPSPIAPGGSVVVSATVTNSSSGAPIAGAPVLISLVSTGLGGVCGGTFGSASPTTNASGGVTARIAVPVCYLGSSAVATVTVSGAGYYGVASRSVAVNLLGFVPALAALASFPDNLVFFVLVMALAIALGGVIGRRPPSTVPYAPAYPTDAPAADPPDAPPGPSVAPPEAPPAGSALPPSPPW